MPGEGAFKERWEEKAQRETFWTSPDLVHQDGQGLIALLFLPDLFAHTLSLQNTLDFLGSFWFPSKSVTDQLYFEPAPEFESFLTDMVSQITISFMTPFTISSTWTKLAFFPVSRFLFSSNSL